MIIKMLFFCNLKGEVIFLGFGKMVNLNVIGVQRDKAFDSLVVLGGGGDTSKTSQHFQF